VTEELKVSFAGIGATGAVLAAALLSADHQVALVDPKPGLDDKPIIFRLLSNKGIQRIFKSFAQHAPVVFPGFLRINGFVAFFALH